MTAREFLREHPVCAYDRTSRAIHREHVVPLAMRRRYRISADDERFHVSACGPCNWRKGTRKLYPPEFDVSILPGKPELWQEWRGGRLPEVKR